MSTKSNMCRITNLGPMAYDEFVIFSRMKCYSYLRFVLPGFVHSFDHNEIAFVTQNNTFVYPGLDLDLKFLKERMSDLEYKKWKDCSDEAIKCCDKMMSENEAHKPNTCPSIWDGWSCHDSTPAGEYSRIKCLDHIVDDTCHVVLDHANFECTKNGTWFSIEGHEWANYTGCTSLTAVIKENLVNTSLYCHYASLLFLIIALIMLFSYRKLKVDRILMHKHLISSLILHSICQIIWIQQFIMPILKLDSGPGPTFCIIAHVVALYTRSTNYFWMFNESFYLFRILTNIYKPLSGLLSFYIIGWIMPLILIIIYVTVSLINGSQNCWIEDIHLTYIVSIPNIIIILLNIVFLIIIVKMLYETLNSSNRLEFNPYMQSFKATLILLPIFGLHFLLTPIVMCDSAPYAYHYNMLNIIVENSQGLLVALIYTVLNAEVRSCLKKTILKSKIYQLIKKTGHNRNETQTCNTELTATATSKSENEKYPRLL